MIRVLSILTAVAALAVSAAPVASAVGSDHAWASYHFKAVSATPVASAGSNTLKNSMVTGFGLKAAPPTAGPSKGRVGGKMHLEDISMGAKASPKILNQDSQRGSS